MGDYLLLEEIARGGMGIVYKARHLELKRLVALKMILSGSLATPAERARFRREAELAANLDHPNIVPIYEVRDQDGMLFFSMKLVDGGNLAQHLATYARNPRATARLVVTLAQALHYAHGKGFIHCDLKPSNVLIDRDGQPQITDFGLARRTARGQLADGHRGHPRHAQLHGARAGRRPAAVDRARDGRLRPGRHPLRAPDRPAPRFAPRP